MNNENSLTNTLLLIVILVVIVVGGVWLYKSFTAGAAQDDTAKVEVTIPGLGDGNATESERN